MEKDEKMQEALEILKKYNRLKNDRDAYLFAIAEWGLGMITCKPNPEDFGV